MAHIATASGAHKILASALRKSDRGCKSWEDTEQRCQLFLIAALLTIKHDPTFTNGKLHETLTKGISNNALIDLGVLERVSTELQINVSPEAFKWITRMIRQRLNWTPAMRPDLPLEERLRRRAALSDVVHALIEATPIVNYEEIKALSVDSTAIVAHARKKKRLYPRKDKKKKNKKVKLPDSAYDGLDPATAAVIARAQGRTLADIRRLSRDPNADGGIPTVESLGLKLHHHVLPREIESSILRMTNSFDPDAQYSGKTPNNTEHGTNKKDSDGHSKIYFGKQVNIISTVHNFSREDAKKQAVFKHEEFNDNYQPSADVPTTNIPNLILAIEAVPAGQAQADPALRAVRRILSYGIVPRFIISDAEFSSSREEVWAGPLRAHGIEQVLAPTKKQFKLKDYEGGLVFGNEVYCPSDDFKAIKKRNRPRPTDSENTAVQEEHDKDIRKFHDTRDKQLQYVSRITRNNPDGGIQVTCCARAGKVGCPLVPGSIETAHEFGLPIIQNPPPPERRGKLCNQNYVNVPVTVIGKFAQAFDFGSPRWERIFTGRSSVEGINSSLKSRHHSGLGRGVHEFTGIAWDNLFVGLAAALHNYRVLNNWAEIFETDIQHILITNDPNEWHGWDLHNKRTALVAALARDGHHYSYEYITHTCDTVETAQTFRRFDEPNDRTSLEPATEVWHDQCDKEHCRVVHTCGGIPELVEQRHWDEVELAADSDSIES